MSTPSRRPAPPVQHSPPSSSHDDSDDDMEYEPPTETDDDVTQDFEDEEDDDTAEDLEFFDAEDDGQDSSVSVILDVLEQAAEEDVEGSTPPFEEAQTTASVDTAQSPAQPGPMTITRNELIALLRQPRLRHLFYASRPTDDDVEEDDDGQQTGYGGVRQRRRRARTSDFPPVPSPEGRSLMESGTFGTNERQNTIARKKKLANNIMRRELGLGSPGAQRSSNRVASQNMIPSSNADTIINYDHRCYSGQFSDDGNFFFSCAQDFKVRMYDTSNPYDWRYYKTVNYPFGQWTITDASLSPNNRYLAYSSIRSIVCLAATDPYDTTEPYALDFSNLGHRSNAGGRHFGIWSIRFSGDNREIVAGTSDNSVYVYDIETRQSVLRIRGHEDDVNAVCFGDTSSPHILYSGSDDTTLKVWDRRSMSDRREAGVFLGHTEGLTYVDSKGDGRYVLSNGKDQNMKLWDLRKMMSSDEAEKVDLAQYSTGFDYRFQQYDDSTYHKHPYDCSLVTFRGHAVLKTLIRCHFSPPGSTDSRYVYSGSEDGSVYIYNMDATLAGKVDVNAATANTRPRGEADFDDFMDFYDDRRGGSSWKTCVRDASWHPNAPVIAATSWNGYGMSQGTCTVHTWNDGLDEDEAEPKMGRRVDAKLNHSSRFYEEPTTQTSRTRWMRSRRLRSLFRDEELNGEADE